MGETSKHIDFVYLLKKVVENDKRIDLGLVYIDTPESRNNCPPIINGYKPDLYYEFDDILIIGEAKTKNDLNNKHTKSQLETYISMCANFGGDSMLLVAVPWTENAFASNLVNNILKKIGVSINFKIIDEIQNI